ncbi:OLC1v1005629C1 [Oldenlandia corymbosa var. corymbosa]|uniref:OLC1v1005629C1 n=1 Tax=Oldenlandia corymbosa var. corymbosa TaxID=529605 RepID=A0AAV1DHR6_OLDCO|nr:OLC1v1005629C1 [Oldenlandia corymbosa var. corymbosa]
MLRTQPRIFTRSTSGIRKVVDFFMNELGYSPDVLASKPAFLTYSFEKRVKPRTELLKFLNENNLNQRKAVLYSVLSMTEPEFLKFYILPYKDSFPDMCDTYLSKAEISKIEQ